jgi:DNA-binding GntR family transcriptional regulator
MLSADIENVIQRIERQTLSDRVYLDLKTLLLTGRLPPGQKLMLRDLSKVLGTSLMPIRDATARLVADRALEMLPNRTLVVPKPTLTRFNHIVQIRLVLEGLAAEMAATKMTADELSKARTHAQEFERYGRSAEPDVVSAIQANRNLHYTVYNGARSEPLVDMIDSLWLQVGPVFCVSMSNTWVRLSSIEAYRHHNMLLAALTQGDGPGARAAIVNDIADAAARIRVHGGLVDGEPEEG